MNWYYEANGQQQGPVPETELDRLLAEGKITLDTLVWREGQAGWAPLRTIRNTPSGSGSAPAPSSPTPGSGLRLSSDPPSATAGSDAPQPGWVRCSLTGRYFPPSEIIYIEGKPYSAAAKPQLVASLQSGAVVPGGSFERNGPAWENRATIGWPKSIWLTMKEVLVNPAACFSTMKREGGLMTPVLFLLIVGVPSLVISQIYGFFFQGAIMALPSMNQGGAGAASAAAMMAGSAVGPVLILIATPIILPIVAFIGSGLIHLSLMLVKGANQPFEATFRAYCYAYATGIAFNILPFCGAYIGLIWSIVSMCIGMGKVHETTTGKGVAGVLIPIGVCCVGAFVLSAVFAGIVAAAASGAGR
jgi:hypothetical protein